MALSKVLLPGESWHLVVEGYGHTDAAATDSEGNFFFSGRHGDGVFQIDPEGRVSIFSDHAPGVSGLHLGPDGNLYGTRWEKNDLIVFEPSGNWKILAEARRPNDLVMTAQGRLFFTSAAGVERFISPHQTEVVATGMASPNGISLSPDQGTVIVSEYAGKHVWAFRVERDGALRYGEPFMTLRVAPEAEHAFGDGATTDVAGRYYVCSALGLQMFDETGRISGVIAKPSSAPLANVEFAGRGHRYLYVTCGGGVYRRLTKTRGAIFNDALRRLPK